jgi:hypothetical protein
MCIRKCGVYKEQNMKGHIIGAVFLSLAVGIFAQEGLGVIRELSGVVEIKKAGDYAWVPARRGDTLERDTIISTGFRSVAVLTLGNSILTVRPLSRVSLEELARQPGQDSVSLRMRVGRIRAEVNPPVGGTVEFTVRSPIATASVRGTVFDFDTVNLNVREGLVNFSAPTGPALPVSAGKGSSVNETSHTTAPPASATDRALTPSPPLGIDSGVSAAGVQTAGAGSAGSGFTPDPGGVPSGPGGDPDPGGDPIDPGSDPSDPGGDPDPPVDSGFTVDIEW